MQNTLMLKISLFIIYCFLGWIWESLYVSIRTRKWVNRGFLYGPMLPIYGFGAMIILWITEPFTDNLLLIYLLGMLGATLLEYVTGDAMERLFKMRYWDYSTHPFNVNGHISLFISLAWGVFSILLVKFINPPIENALATVPFNVAKPICLVIIALLLVDTIKSVQAALNTKELLKKLTENNKSLEMLEKKLTSIANSVEEGSNDFKKQLQKIELDAKENITTFKQQKETQKKARQSSLLEKLREHRDKKSKLVDLLNKKADVAIAEVNVQMQSTLSENKEEKLNHQLKELYRFKEVLNQAQLNMTALKEKQYKLASNLIRRNPTSISRHFNDAFKEIKSLNENRKKRNKK